MNETFPASATLQSLKLQPGDTLIVREVLGDSVTITLNRNELTDRQKSMRAFLDKWTGAFSLPENVDDDPRLAYIIAKHVK